MSYFVAYLGALLVFGVLDLSWLSIMGPKLYRPALSDILLANLRIAPAVVFYLAYPIGIAAFAAAPLHDLHFKQKNPSTLQLNTTTLRIDVPDRSAENASLISSSDMRLVIISSSIKFPFK